MRKLGSILEWEERIISPFFESVFVLKNKTIILISYDPKSSLLPAKSSNLSPPVCSKNDL